MTFEDLARRIPSIVAGEERLRPPAADAGARQTRRRSGGGRDLNLSRSNQTHVAVALSHSGIRATYTAQLDDDGS